MTDWARAFLILCAAFMLGTLLRASGLLIWAEGCWPGLGVWQHFLRGCP
jgi:hypothetical protein